MLKRLQDQKKAVEGKIPSQDKDFVENRIVGGGSLFDIPQREQTVAKHIYESQVHQGKRPASSTDEQIREDEECASTIVEIQQLNRVIRRIEH